MTQLTKRELERMLPDHPRGINEQWFDWFHKDQIVSMIFPEYLEPKPYEIIEKKEFIYSGKRFSSILRILDGHEWFYCETIENGNNISNPGIDSISVLDSEKMESSGGEVAIKDLDTRHGGDSALITPIPPEKVPAVSNIHASGNLTLSEIEEKKEDIQIYNDAQKYAMNSRSENTIEGYKKDFRGFHNFCVRKNLDSLPANPETVIAYITWMAQGNKTATIKRHLAAIKFVHENSNHSSPVTKDVKNILDGIKRTHGDRSESKKPLLASHIQEICKCLSPTDLADIRDKALLLINFSGCFRRSELVSLNVEDVHLVEGKGIEIILRRSKTDQHGHGTIKAIPYGEDLTCPVLALRHWLLSAGIISGAIFRGFDINGNLMNERLTDRSVPNIIKRLVELIGLDPTEYSGHSTRSGAATQAALNHASPSRIKNLGGWKSISTVDRYIKTVNRFEEKPDLGL